MYDELVKKVDVIDTSKLVRENKSYCFKKYSKFPLMMQK